MGQGVGLHIDPGRKLPLHRQIFDQVVERIESQAFPPGFKLPPTRRLAKVLAAHRNTVMRAYADLEAAGFVSSTVGRGTFVVARSLAAAARPPCSSQRAEEMPWAALLSRVGTTENFARAERYARSDRQNVVNLARMQPSFDLVPEELLRRCISRAMSEQGAAVMAYAPAEGVFRLREQIAQDLVQRGVPAAPDDVVITSGSQQGLDLVIRALVSPGDTVLVESLTYSGAIDLFSLAGAHLVAVQGDAEGPLPEALARVARNGIKALYLMPNANNPTGRTISGPRRHALIAWSEATGIPIIEDDYAAGLVLDDADAPPHLRALHGDVIHVSTFSKRLAPALRVGYVVAPARLRRVLASMKRVVDLGASLMLQHAVAEFMERGYLRAHGQKVVREYRARRDVLDRVLRKAVPQEVTWQIPSHGVVLWLSLPAILDPDAVYHEALRRGVLVSPSPMWSVDGQSEPGLRLAFCAEPGDRLAEGAKRLGKAIVHLLGRSVKTPATDRSVIEAV